MKRKATLTIRMSAARWEALVRHDDNLLLFDFRAMNKRQRNDVHREIMNGVRQVLRPRAAIAA